MAICPKGNSMCHIRGFTAGNPTEHHDVRHSVSTKPITPVDTASNFATGE